MKTVNITEHIPSFLSHLKLLRHFLKNGKKIRDCFLIAIVFFFLNNIHEAA